MRRSGNCCVLEKAAGDDPPVTRTFPNCTRRAVPLGPCSWPQPCIAIPSRRKTQSGRWTEMFYLFSEVAAGQCASPRSFSCGCARRNERRPRRPRARRLRNRMSSYRPSRAEIAAGDPLCGSASVLPRSGKGRARCTSSCRGLANRKFAPT